MNNQQPYIHIFFPNKNKDVKYFRFLKLESFHAAKYFTQLLKPLNQSQGTVSTIKRFNLSNLNRLQMLSSNIVSPFPNFTLQNTIIMVSRFMILITLLERKFRTALI